MYKSVARRKRAPRRESIRPFAPRCAAGRCSCRTASLAPPCGSAGRRSCHTCSDLRSCKGNMQHAWPLFVMKQLHRDWPRVLARLPGDHAATVVVLLAIDGVDGSQHQAQAIASFDLTRDERELPKLVVKRLGGVNEFGLARTFPVAGAKRVGGELQRGPG